MTLSKSKNKSLKKNIQNGIWLYLLQFFNFVVPLLTLPYITRILGSGAYGVFSIAINIISYLQVLVEYGFIMSATRKVAIEGKKNLNKLFSAVIYSRLILLFISFLISIVYIFIKRNDIELVTSFSLLFICLIGTSIQMNWVYQGLQDMKFISIVNIVSRSISTILIFIFVKSHSDLFLYSILYAVSPFMSGVVGLIVAKLRYKLHLLKFDKNDVIAELKNGFYVFTTQLSAKVFGAIGITFLGIFATNSTVGIFSAIQKIPNVLILLWTPIDQVIFPITSQQFHVSYSNGITFIRKIRKIIMPIFIILSLVCAFLGKAGIGILFGLEYSKYYYWLYPLLGWLIVSIDNNFWGVQALLGSGHDKEYGEAFQLAVVMTIIFNLILTKLYGGLGASLAPLLSELTLNLLLRSKLKKVTFDAELQIEIGNKEKAR